MLPRFTVLFVGQVMITCVACGSVVDRLDVFPGGVCLPCWAVSPEGRRMPTAGELVRMWGGKQ